MYELAETGPMGRWLVSPWLKFLLLARQWHTVDGPDVSRDSQAQISDTTITGAQKRIRL